MATHSNILAWRVPMEDPGGLQSMGSQRVRHDRMTKHSTALSATDPFSVPLTLLSAPQHTTESPLRGSQREAGLPSASD